MSDWADEEANRVIARDMDDWEFDLERRVAAAIRAAGRKWQPIETARRDGDEILVWDGSVVTTIGFQALARMPTHWMPLPAPPLT